MGYVPPPPKGPENSFFTEGGIRRDSMRFGPPEKPDSGALLFGFLLGIFSALIGVWMIS